MPEIRIEEVRNFLKEIEGQEISLDKLRSELGIEKYDTQGHIAKSFNSIRGMVFELVEQKFLRYVGRGLYRVVIQVEPVQVFGIEREDIPPFDLKFPRAFDSEMEMDFANDVVVRQGDLITIGGVKSSGKTQLCLGILGENINKYPVIMGNEFTFELSAEEQKKQGKKYDVVPRFYNRIKTMGEWINWKDDNGIEKFTLLPVWDDYAEHIVKNKINIVDYVSLAADKLYDVGKVLRGIKTNVGRGVAIATLQKKEGAIDPRGGQFVRDSADLELLLDGFGDDTDDVLLTIRGCKEKHKPIVGKTYAYTIGGNGTKIFNFREVKKCPDCKGQGFKAGKPCETCFTKKYIDK